MTAENEAIMQLHFPSLGDGMSQPLIKALLVAVLFFWVASGAQALSLADISGKEAGAGMKEALMQGAARAVDLLGRPDGFLGNPKVKIPLPGALEQAEGLMRAMGMGKQADELVTAMNRAAEAAVPEAKKLLVDAVKQMSVEDAKAILTGGQDAATRYFEQKTRGPLGQKFLPIVRKAIDKVKLKDRYEKFAGKGAKLGLISEKDAHLDTYVAEKALDGLY
ncbi:MAG: DUF4197 domain-containing protein, partial [Agrobacterium albertimagni]